MSNSNAVISTNGFLPNMQMEASGSVTTYASVPVTNTIDRYRQEAYYLVKAKDSVGHVKYLKLQFLSSILEG